MRGEHRRAFWHDQEGTPGNALDVAAETENETGDKVDDAPGFRVSHVLEVDDHGDFLAKVIADGCGVLEVPRTHYCDLGTVTRGQVAVQVFIAVDLAEILGTVVMLDATEPSAGVAWHYANLRQYEPIHGRPSGETLVERPKPQRTGVHRTLTRKTVRSASTRR